jgi:hypothetical protein
LRRREVPGLLLILKAGSLVRTVAKGLICGMAAPAQRERCAAAEAECLCFRVAQINFALDEQGSIITDSDFGSWHLNSLDVGCAGIFETHGWKTRP